MSVLLAILGIGFLIFVHELGHYLACRLTRTRVETFSIGFGPRLFGWESLPGEPKRLTVGRRRLDAAQHAMDFRVAAVPLGGYVKMAGENPGEDRTGSPDEFPSKPMMSRVFIVSAGVIMNVIAAWVLYVVAYGSNIELEPAVAGLVSKGGPAWSAEMEPGDRVLTLDGERVRSFLELKMETVFLGTDEAVPTLVDRFGEERTLDVMPRYDEEAGAIRLQIRPASTVSLTQDDVTTEIGPFDRITVDGLTATGGLQAAQFVELAFASGKSTVEIVREDGQAVTLRWTPGKADTATYKLGIEPYGHPVVKAVRGAAAHTYQPGDRLVAAHGGSKRTEILGTTDLIRLPSMAPIDHLEIERGARQLQIPIAGDTPQALFDALADIAWERTKGTTTRPLALGTLVSGEGGRVLRYPSVPSEAAGLAPGDRILQVGDRTVSSWADIIEAVGRIKVPTEIELVVAGSDNVDRSIRMTPVALEVLEGPEILVTPYMEPYETDGIGDAMAVASARTAREIQNIFRLLGAFFTGRLSFQKNIGGPGTIVKVSADAAKQDPLRFLLFLAYISITLAVLNILPIPILDGGHLLFILIEKIKGSPLKDETIGRLQFIGLMLLLVLMFFAVKNDITFLGR